MALKLLSTALLVAGMIDLVQGHGYVTSPVSRNELASILREKCSFCGAFKYCPHCSANGNLAGVMQNNPGNACGASEKEYTEGLSTWQSQYGGRMPTLSPGSDLTLTQRITADHGGQAWMQIACGDAISDNLNWVFLERAQSDRNHHFMPNNPGIFAWSQQEFGKKDVDAKWHVPAGFSCPSGYAFGRWVWKTGNSCFDANNVGRPTETFSVADFRKAAPRSNNLATCTAPPETFFSCFDFKIGAGGGSSGGGGGASPNPSPTPAPPGSGGFDGGTTRCGSSWTDANGRCGAPCPTGTDDECASGETCFADLAACTGGGGSGGGPSPTPEPEKEGGGNCAAVWTKCGGKGWSGPTCCTAGNSCQFGNPWYSQCRPGGSALLETQQFEDEATLKATCRSLHGEGKSMSLCGEIDW